MKKILLIIGLLCFSVSNAQIITNSDTTKKLDQSRRMGIDGEPVKFQVKRTLTSAPVPPDAPILTTPDNGANVDVADLFLFWNGVNGSPTYRVQIDSVSSAFNNIHYNQTTSSTSRNVSAVVSYGKQYWWRVNATTGAGTSDWSSVRTFTTNELPLVYPARDGSAIMAHADSQYIWCQYNAFEYPYKASDSIRMFYKRYPGGRTWYATSVDGTTFQNKAMITTDIGTHFYDQGVFRIANDSMKGFLHPSPPVGGRHYRLIVNKSTDDGKSWTLTTDTMYTGDKSDSTQMFTGEDVTVAYNPDSTKWNVYFRDSTTQNLSGYPADQYPLRTIAITRTTDWKNFTARRVIIPLTRSNFHNTNSKDYRIVWNNFSVMRVSASEWWGFANVIKQQPNAKENQEGSTEDTVGVRLYYSTNGEDWQACNDSMNFIWLPSGIKQVFAQPVLHGTDVWIYTIQTPRPHISGSVSGYPADKFEIWRYTITLTNLRRFIP